jgi:hypothetical protein
VFEMACAFIFLFFVYIHNNETFHGEN